MRHSRARAWSSSESSGGAAGWSPCCADNGPEPGARPDESAAQVYRRYLQLPPGHCPGSPGWRFGSRKARRSRAGSAPERRCSRSLALPFPIRGPRGAVDHLDQDSSTVAQGAAGPGLGVLALVEDELAVDDHVLDSLAVLERLGVGGVVDDGRSGRRS